MQRSNAIKRLFPADRDKEARRNNWYKCIQMKTSLALEKQGSKTGLGKSWLSDHKHQVRTVKSWIQKRSDIYMEYQKVELIAVLSKSQVCGCESRLRACPPKSFLPSTQLPVWTLQVNETQTHVPLRKQEHCCMHWKQGEIILQYISKLPLWQQAHNNFYTINCHLCLPSIRSCLQRPAV